MTLWLSLLACGSDLPTTRDSHTTATDSGAADSGTTTVTAPDWCQEPAQGMLQEITTDHPGAPYFISHPFEPKGSTHTVIFLGGGSGDKGSAQASWDLFFTQGDGIAEIRAVLPWAETGSLSDDSARILTLRDEVLACYGGSADSVHLAGTSNGGVMAYDLALEGSGAFATLLGIPGVPSSWSRDDLAAPLAGMRIYNAVGSDDTSWKAEVERVHAAMVDEGLDATYSELEGYGHVVSPDWDETVLYDFWLDR